VADSCCKVTGAIPMIFIMVWYFMNMDYVMLLKIEPLQKQLDAAAALWLYVVSCQ
jgi:hypothetical protein